MSDALAGDIVLGCAGLLLGSLLQVVHMLGGGRVERVRQSSSFWKSVHDSTTGGRDIWTQSTGSFKLAVLALYGLIGVVWAGLKFASIAMNWWVLLGTLLAGFMVTEAIFDYAKRGVRQTETPGPTHA